MNSSGSRIRLVLLLAGMTVFVPSVASAQLSAFGASKMAVGAPVRGTDSAFDPVNHVFLVVGAYGPVQGTFTAPDGTVVSGTFDLNIPNGGIFAHYPRVVYSPGVNNGAGGFLTLWHQNDGPGGVNMVHARVVAYPGGPIGADTTINVGDVGTWWEAGSPAAYSPVSQKFLVAWQTCCGGGSDVRYRLVDLAGNPVGGVVTVSGGYGRDPNVAWNPNTNEWAVAYCGTDLSGAIAAIGRVNGAGTLVRRATLYRDLATYINDVAYNPSTGNYVMVFSAPFSGGTRGLEANVNADLVAEGLISSIVGAYDGMGLSRSPVSGSMLLVGHHSSSSNVGALELTKRGSRSGNERVITSTNPQPTMGSFYPRASFSTIAPRWLITYSKDFSATFVQEVDTTTTNGGADIPLGPLQSPSPSPSPSPTPTPTPTPTGGCTTPDPFAAMGGGTCYNGGWYPPGSAPGPAPAPAPTPTPTPTPAPVPQSGGCTTPDPFAAMGGGTCYNGGWYPPGSIAPAPAPAPAPTPTPTPTPAPSAGCTTPDPFAAMGGGTCVNGGWLPPGIAPTAPSNGCPGSDPFASSGGGVCINGGWVPRNSLPTSSCVGSDPFVPMGGGVCINGGWVPRSAIGGAPIAFLDLSHLIPAEWSASPANGFARPGRIGSAILTS
jgi:hypothetical protein